MRNLRRHADRFTQRRVGMDGLADIHCVSAHLDRQCNLANHVARMRADHAAAQDLAMAMRFLRIVKPGGMFLQRMPLSSYRKVAVSTLHKLPLTGIKIDKSFVDGLPHKHESQSLTRAILGLTKNFGMQNSAN
jgi:hypothetical protein